MSYGITAEGFALKPLSAILADMQDRQLAEISPSLDLQPTALLGVLNGIVAQAAFDAWEVLQACYNGMDPDGAADAQLTSLSLITGTEREGAQKTQVVGCTVNVDASFSADAGTMFANVTGNALALFTNKSLVENTGGSPANVTADFEAVTAGPTQCLAGTLTEIAQPLSGWNSITNPDDGTIGTNIEADAPLRVRRNAELSAVGSATADAIRSDVLQQMQPPTTSSATSSVTVLYNDTDATDANGVPPHSIEVIARQVGATSGDDTALATLILESKAAGIGTHGTSSKNITDSQGNVQTVYYTRPTAVPIYCDITVVTNDDFPDDGEDQIKAALAAHADEFWTAGATVYVQRAKSAVFDVAGVVDVTTFLLDDVDPPVASTNIAMTARQIATLSTGDIDVTVT